jgi:hypothetical protein
LDSSVWTAATATDTVIVLRNTAMLRALPFFADTHVQLHQSTLQFAASCGTFLSLPVGIYPTLHIHAMHLFKWRLFCSCTPLLEYMHGVHALAHAWSACIGSCTSCHIPSILLSRIIGFHCGTKPKQRPANRAPYHAKYNILMFSGYQMVCSSTNSCSDRL